MLKSKRRLQLIEREIKLLEKTLVNSCTAFYLKLQSGEVDDKEAEFYKRLTSSIEELVPSGAEYLDTVQFWQPEFEDYDDPIDFSEIEEEKPKKHKKQ